MYTQTANSTTNSQPLITEPFYSNELLICATKGYIFALRKSTGHIIWKLQIASSSCIISLFITDTDTIIAGTLNKTFSINLMTGKTNWINKVQLDEHKETIVLALPSPQLQSSNTEDLPPPYDGPPEHRTSESQPSEPQLSQYIPFILTFSKGLVTAIHPKSGITQWKYTIGSNDLQLPVAIIDPPNNRTNRHTIFIGISRTVYSLDAEIGSLNWKIQLTHISSGSKRIALATS